MTRLLRLTCCLAVLILAMLGQQVHAENVFEQLMMPGELSEPHAKLETDCANCHVKLDRTAQENLCLSCHKDIKADKAAQLGFHGRDRIVAVSECAVCHSEHKGRSASIVRLEPALFNHDTTDFPLRGRHSLQACNLCHQTGKKFSAAPHECFACHGREEPHRGQLGTKCETCHSVDGWKKVAAFNHAQTKFPLKGAHASVACISCHVGEVYKGLSTACNDCHALQDVHATRFGPACNDCHSLENWKTAKFDHGKATRFPLLGAHAAAKCNDCHGENLRARISMACYDCHKTQDVHKAQLGRDCGSCHGAVAWRQNVKFDHGLTSYPLLGLHVAVACESCHASAAFKGAPTQCYACHKADDKHAGRFASRCESCHSPNGWGRVKFDHARDAGYPLTGRHANVGCYGCHTATDVKSAKISTNCVSCHSKQDVHRGKFGTDCARCHTTATFKTAIIRQ